MEMQKFFLANLLLHTIVQNKFLKGKIFIYSDINNMV